MVLKKFSDFLVKYKAIIIIIVAVILALSIVGTVLLVTQKDKINSDMMSYMSGDFDTSTGLEFMDKNFGITGTSMLVVRGDKKDAALEKSIDNIKAMNGVKQVIWKADVDSMNAIKDSFEGIDLGDLSKVDKDKLQQILEDRNITELVDAANLSALLSLLDMKDFDVNTTDLEKYLMRPIDGSEQYDYVIMIMMSYSPSTQEAFTLLDNIKSEFSGREIAGAGMTETAQVVMNDTLADIPNFLIYAVIAVMVILLLTTSSFIEPFILAVTLGVSIVISMGTNYLFPSISVISFATSAILQLAITMDYAIFYMHTYKKYRKDVNAIDATKAAIPEVASSILASALTTIGGFAALYFMRFGIGADLAGVIMKGVAMSLATVLILQPVLTLMLDKVIAKTTHRFTEQINAKIALKHPGKTGFSKEKINYPIAKFSVWARIVLVVVAVALLVPTFIGQSKLNYSYFEMYEQSLDTPEQKLAYELGNQMILAVPITTKTGSHAEFIEKIKDDPNGKVSGVVSAFTALNVSGEQMSAILYLLANSSSLDTIKNLPNDEFKADLLEAGIDWDKIDWEGLATAMEGMDTDMLEGYFTKVDNKYYTLYTISIKGSAEDDAAAATYERILDLRNTYFGKKTSYSIGMLTGSYDMRVVTPTDFLRVTVVSVAIILLIVALLLRNPLKSLIIVILIELGIWVNLSLTYILGEPINFMVYIIISSVQLGCTVDYAILLANTFENNRVKYKSGKECAINSAVEAMPAILTSCIIIVTVCMSVFFVSNNLIIKQLTGMLARGAAISVVLVIFVQTAIMSFFKTERRDRGLKAKLKAVEEKIETENKQN